MLGICSCTTAHIMVPINCRYHCSSITEAIINLRRETTALAQRCGITYSGRYCDSNLVRLELLRAVTSIRAARAHDQADGDARDHALRLGAPGRGTMSASLGTPPAQRICSLALTQPA